MYSVKQSADGIGARFGAFVGFAALAGMLLWCGFDHVSLSIVTSIALALCFGYGVSFALFVYEYASVRRDGLHVVWADNELVDDPEFMNTFLNAWNKWRNVDDRMG